MKKNYLLIIALFAGLFAKSQDTIRFESFNLAVDSFWNGSDRSGGFTDYSTPLPLRFDNLYDTNYYSWEGFAYSNKKDSTTAGYLNQYSCIAASGADTSETYVVGYVGYSGLPQITVPFVSVRSSNGNFIKGLYVNNSTYAYLSMKNGDGYGKKFGDTLDANGVDDGTNGEDWLKLTIFNTGTPSDSIDFYLADFRFTDSADDYIIKDWTFVDLSSLTNLTGLSFNLRSSDNDPIYGMKTPGYFCIDNVIVDPSEYFTGIDEELAINLSIYPNPTTDYVTVKFSELTSNYSLSLFDANGRVVKQISSVTNTQLVFDMTSLHKGTYFVQLNDGQNTVTKRIIKQ